MGYLFQLGETAHKSVHNYWKIYQGCRHACSTSQGHWHVLTFLQKNLLLYELHLNFKWRRATIPFRSQMISHPMLCKCSVNEIEKIQDTSKNKQCKSLHFVYKHVLVQTKYSVLCIADECQVYWRNAKDWKSHGHLITSLENVLTIQDTSKNKQCKSLHFVYKHVLVQTKYSVLCIADECQVYWRNAKDWKSHGHLITSLENVLTTKYE